jgi:hypothetical protein
MAEQREFSLKVTVNGKRYDRVLIDSHYQERHHESVHDFLVLRLVKMLEGAFFQPESILPSGYEIFVNDGWVLNGVPYRLIWTTHPEKDYLGVINAFRRPRGKKKE